MEEKLPTADSVIASINRGQVTRCQNFVYLVSDGVARADLAFVRGVHVDDHDVATLSLRALEIEAADEFMRKVLRRRMLQNYLNNRHVPPILQANMKMGGRG